ncbi:urease subunit beta [Rhodococcus sp. ARC_M6]|uniref:urease subunit beta n=1 Tax=Rhodococcus sp. ARC_M6 TaxID=2928852 RepID=UPI001FB1E824|nr:urease subunit beta [Rhodococcus sp. ARC_M6]MCJ0904412.1 urease subunit beta [Rhodococcus sp. ARC_M6]
MAAQSKKGAAQAARVPVGGYVLKDEPVEINAGKPRIKMRVRNTGDRPIQVGSHFHFMEVNRALRFDRERTFGWRLDIPAGTAVRFEPGDEKEVTLVPFGGKQRVHGFNNLVDGWAPTHATYRPRLGRAVRLATEQGFESETETAE